MITARLKSHDGARRGSVTWDPETKAIEVDPGSLSPRELDTIRRMMSETFEAEGRPPDGQLDGGKPTTHHPAESAEAFRHAVDLLPSRAWVIPQWVAA